MAALQISAVAAKRFRLKVISTIVSSRWLLWIRSGARHLWV